MFKWATFREILLPSSGNVNDMPRIFKGNMRTFTEKIKLADKKKLRNVMALQTSTMKLEQNS